MANNTNNKPNSTKGNTLSLGMREDGTYKSGYNVTYDYVFRYIDEAIESRGPLISYTGRAIQAYQGYPMRDNYVGKYEEYAKAYVGEDNERYQRILDDCKHLRARQNFTVKRAIDTMVSQAMGGVARYEAVVYDPHFEMDKSIVDKLNAGAKNVWSDNRMDAMLPQMIEGAGLSGASYALLSKKSDSDKELDVTYIPVTEMLLDPIRLKRNSPRYIGHQTKKAWADLKKYLVKDDYTDEYKLQSINEVDQYLEEVKFWLSKYGGDFDSINARCQDENLKADINKFYLGGALVNDERNTAYLQEAGSDGKDDTMYRADDVEVIYLFDLENKIQFTVVNRRFIVEAKKPYLTNYIDYTYPKVDPFSGSVTKDVGSAKIHLDSPYVALEYKRSFWMNYAYSPIIDLLDTFDDICALESLIYHTISIMTPITFTGNPTDIEKLSKIVGVSGEVIKGFIANSVTVLNKAVDLTPALTELDRLEQNIKWILNGPDAAAQMQMLGDRASGTEASMANGVVTQGLNPIIANIEAFAADFAEKSFKLLAIENGDDWEYAFPMNFQIATLSKENLSGQIRFRAVLKNRIKVEARQTAQTTLQWFTPLVQSDVIPNKEAMVQDVVPLLAEGFTREQIASWFKLTPEQQNEKDAQMNLMQAATQSANKGNIDLSQVNPSGKNGEFSTADIASALGGTADAQGRTTQGPQASDKTFNADGSTGSSSTGSSSTSTTGDMSPSDPEPYTGGRAPSGTSRSLQYGITMNDDDQRIPIPALTPDEVDSMDQEPLVPEYLTPEATDAMSELVASSDPTIGGDELRASTAMKDPYANMFGSGAGLETNDLGATYQNNSNAAMFGDYSGGLGYANPASIDNRNSYSPSGSKGISYNPESGGIAANDPSKNL